MKTDHVRVLWNLYIELATNTEFSEIHELPPKGLFCPMKVNGTTGLWVSIVPNIHNPHGQFTRSARLRVYEPKEPNGIEEVRVYIEFQALDSDNPEILNGIEAFILLPGFGANLAKIELCRSIADRVREVAHS